MKLQILKRLGHVPSTTSAIVVGIVWAAMIFQGKIEADGQASMAMLGAVLFGLFYKSNDPKPNDSEKTNL